MSDNVQISKEFLRLVNIMKVLRSPQGCSWDRKQTIATMGKHVSGEAAEAVEALNAGEPLHIKEELGDLLMTIVMSALIAEENGTFDLADVVHDICEKMLIRHPHIFGENADNRLTPEEVIDMWGKVKSVEKAEKATLTHQMEEAEGFKSAIGSAIKIHKIASSVGFDWGSAEEAFHKIPEETKEVEEAIKSGDKANLEEEIGDLLFATLNIARLSGIDAEKALRATSHKFVSRFSTVEKMALADGGFEGKSLEQLDVYWNKAKEDEKNRNNTSQKRV